MQYELKAPATGMALRNGNRSLLTIPTGQIVTVVGHATDPRLLIVSVQDREFLMFESHLKQQGVQILFATA